jgi:hypothetical protein
MGFRAPAERDVLATCRDWLALWGAVAVRVNSGAMRVENRYVKFNDAPGCSDTLVCLPGTGRFLALELKRPGRDRTSAKRRAEQAAFQAQILAAGGLVVVARSLDELRDQLRAAGYDTQRRV